MAAEGVNAVDIAPQCKPTIQSRFSTLRFMKVVNQFNPIQRSYISNHNLDNLSKLPDHLMVPMHFQQWFAFHTSNGFFCHKDKIIFFTKDIVDKVFGFPGGTKPFVFGSTDPEVVAEVEELRSQYLQGKDIPVKKLESMLLGASSEDKLMKHPTVFDKNWVVGQFNRILNADFDIPKTDIFNFPTVVYEHWVLLSANPLFDTINFFDPTSMTNAADQHHIMSNLASNLNTVFKELKIGFKDFEKFKRFNTHNYPCQSAKHDDGIYVMLYSENWTGKFMKSFSKEIIPKYRMLKSYDMFYSIQNEVVVESFEKRKKRKVSSRAT